MGAWNSPGCGRGLERSPGPVSSGKGGLGVRCSPYHWKQVNRNCRWLKSCCCCQDTRKFRARAPENGHALRGQSHKIPFSLYMKPKRKPQHLCILALAAIASSNGWCSLQVLFSRDSAHCFSVAFLWFLLLQRYSQRLGNYNLFLPSVCWLYLTGIVFLCSRQEWPLW